MNYTDAVLARVWLKAATIDAENERRGFRKDACGAWIRWSDYGNRNSQFGWEIDHGRPQALGGSDRIGNLRPLHWRNNAAKSDAGLVCAVTSLGIQNVVKNTGLGHGLF